VSLRRAKVARMNKELPDEDEDIGNDDKTTEIVVVTTV
jgi:hypothetical protein